MGGVTSAPAYGADVTLTISGNVVNESTTLITTYVDPNVTKGLEVVIDNPLITEMATLNAVSEIVKDLYLRKVETTVPYLGYPELETGDTLNFNTNYGSFKGDISKVALTFNGGFSGTVIAKMRNVGALDTSSTSSWRCGEPICGEV